MTPLLEQFLSESSEFTHGIGEKLMRLEEAPNDRVAMDELFRLMHTLKGNSGLFTFPEMTRVLHAGEDLLGMVRSGEIAYSRKLADCLLEAMDFVMVLCADIESTEAIDASRAEGSVRMAEALRALMPATATPHDSGGVPSASTGQRSASGAIQPKPAPAPFDAIPEAVRLEAVLLCQGGTNLHWIVYSPEPECFFQGDDPFHRARLTPGLLWGCARQREPFPPLAELDTYRCVLGFDLLTAAPREELVNYFRYMPDQAPILAVDPQWLEPAGLAETKRLDSSAGHVRTDDECFLTESDSSQAERAFSGLSKENAAALDTILSNQERILMLPDRPRWNAGRTKAVASVLTNISRTVGDAAAADPIAAALAQALASGKSAPLLEWLQAWKIETSGPSAIDGEQSKESDDPPNAPGLPIEVESGRQAEIRSFIPAQQASSTQQPPEDGIKFGRRAEDAYNGPKSLKVDQAKIDLLMNLIGELVVSKNA